MFPLTLHQLHTIVGGRLRLATLGPADGEWTRISPITADSRQLQPGEVFWAFKGRTQNGADFTEHAFARGASGVVSDKYVQPWPSCWALQVDDGREALFQLARWQREHFLGDFVMVAGTMGTATTRHLTNALLGRRLKGSVCPPCNGRTGSLALSMLALSPEHQYAVCDLNLSAPGDVSSILAESLPRVAVITDISKTRSASVHLGSLHDSVLQVVTHLPENGTAVLNGDDPAIRRAASFCRADTIWVGESSDCNLVARRVLSVGGRLHFEIDGQAFELSVWGRHQLTHVLGAIGVGRAFGLSLAEMARTLADLDPPPGRIHAAEQMAPMTAKAAVLPTIVQAGERMADTLLSSARHILRFDSAHKSLRRAA